MGRGMKKHTTAKLIFNPHSGKGDRAGDRLKEAVECLERHGILVDVVITGPTERATLLARAAVRLGYKLIIAMGGDGTVEAVARGLVGTRGRLGIVPAGTYNNVATSLGIPKDLEGACAVLEEGHRRRIDVGQVKSKKYGKIYFLEAAVVGLQAALYPVGEAVAKRRLSGVVDGVKTLIHFPLPKVKIRMNGGNRLQGHSLLVVVANTPNFGADYLIAPDASLDDGKLDVSLYSGFSKIDLLAHFARVSGERSTGSAYVQHYQARKVRIKTTPRQKVMADDRRLGKGAITVSVLPRALRVVAPEHVTEPRVRRSYEELPDSLTPSPSPDGRGKEEVPLAG